jgi:hypothetical protein
MYGITRNDRMGCVGFIPTYSVLDVVSRKLRAVGRSRTVLRVRGPFSQTVSCTRSHTRQATWIIFKTRMWANYRNHFSFPWRHISIDVYGTNHDSSGWLKRRRLGMQKKDNRVPTERVLL